MPHKNLLALFSMTEQKPATLTKTLQDGSLSLTFSSEEDNEKIVFTYDILTNTVKLHINGEELSFSGCEVMTTELHSKNKARRRIQATNDSTSESPSESPSKPASEDTIEKKPSTPSSERVYPPNDFRSVSKTPYLKKLNVAPFQWAQAAVDFSLAWSSLNIPKDYISSEPNFVKKLYDSLYETGFEYLVVNQEKRPEEKREVVLVSDIVKGFVECYDLRNNHEFFNGRHASQVIALVRFLLFPIGKQLGYSNEDFMGTRVLSKYMKQSKETT